jgi:hypothetical protein
VKRVTYLTWALTSALLSSCTSADYGGLEVTQQSNPPLELNGVDVEVSSREIRLPVGIAVLVKVLPVSGNDQPYTANDELELSSQNPSVFGAFETDRSTRVVLTGASVGRSCLRVVINGEQQDCLSVVVVEQPLPDSE